MNKFGFILVSLLLVSTSVVFADPVNSTAMHHEVYTDADGDTCIIEINAYTYFTHYTDTCVDKRFTRR